MGSPQHELLPYLVDLESPYEPDARRAYDPVDLVRFALSISEYWAGLALRWLEQGVPTVALTDELAALERRDDRPQQLRHQARKLRKHLI